METMHMNRQSKGTFVVAFIKYTNSGGTIRSSGLHSVGLGQYCAQAQVPVHLCSTADIALLVFS